MSIMSRYEQDILSAVSLRGSVSTAELASLLGVSDQTVRRVVKPMADRGEVTKLHGVVIATERATEPPFLARMQVNHRAKVAIATAVAGLIADGERLALDVGSTTGYVAQALRQHRNLNVVTNSSFIATSLATITGNRVHMAGVELRNHDGAAFDEAAFATVRSFRVRTTVLSASAVHPAHGFMVHDHCEAEMSKAMAAIAERRILAVDHSKFAKIALLALDVLRPGDVVVTDSRPPRSFARLLRELTVLVAR
jgi:DeoR family transcriptional regulator, glycerol-3-phosphate regulon repressor